jgi:hypothetical protein
VIGIFIFFALVYIEVLYCFEASVPHVSVACYGRNLPCQLCNDWMTISFDIILPSIFLAIFGILTIRNAQSMVIHPVVNTINSNNNRLLVHNNDRNVTRMLLVQVNLTVVLNRCS